MFANRIIRLTARTNQINRGVRYNFTKTNVISSLIEKYHPLQQEINQIKNPMLRYKFITKSIEQQKIKYDNYSVIAISLGLISGSLSLTTMGILLSFKTFLILNCPFWIKNSYHYNMIDKLNRQLIICENEHTTNESNKKISQH